MILDMRGKDKAYHGKRETLAKRIVEDEKVFARL